MSDFSNNKKYQDLTNTARDLFWKYGISRVSIKEICSEAGVSKMTFYRFFSNKTELAKKVMDIVFGESLQNYRNVMSEEVPFAEKVRKSLILKFEATKEISHEFVKDVYNNSDVELKNYLEEKRNAIINEILNDYVKAQKKGWIRKDIKPEFILYFLNKAYEISSDDGLLSIYDSQQDIIMELTNFFFYGIGVKDV